MKGMWSHFKPLNRYSICFQQLEKNCNERDGYKELWDGMDLSVKVNHDELFIRFQQTKTRAENLAREIRDMTKKDKIPNLKRLFSVLDVNV